MRGDETGGLDRFVLAGHVLQVRRALQKRCRNLTSYQRAELALVLEPLIAAKAKERQVAAQNNNAGMAVRENSRELEQKGRTDESLAQIAGISSNTIRRAKVIKEQGTRKSHSK